MNHPFAHDLVRRLRLMLGTLLPLPEPTPFVIVSRGRSGSNLLMSLLSSHPRIHVWGEVIGEDLVQRDYHKKRIHALGPVPYVQTHLQRCGFEAAVGIKILYYQVESEYERQWGVSGLNDVFTYLKERKDLKIIHLKRRNRLKVLASNRVALLTNEFELYRDHGGSGGDVNLTLSPAECNQWFQSTGDWERQYDQAFREHDNLEIWYEDLVAKRELECNRVLDFLGMPRRELTSPMKKQQRRPLSTVIDNFDELKSYYRESEYAWFFEESKDA